MAQNESEINKLFLSPDSKEVAYKIFAHITNTLIKHFQCEMCSLIMVGNDSDKAAAKEFFELLSQGGLTVHSRQMVKFVCACFAILEYADQFIVKKSWIHNKSVYRTSFENIFSKILFYIFKTH